MYILSSIHLLFIVYLLFSTMYLLSAIFCLLSSIFDLLSSVFYLLSPIFYLLFSINPLSSICFLLSFIFSVSLSLSPSLTSPAFQLYPIMIKSQVKIVFTLCRRAQSRLDEPRLRISSSCLVFRPVSLSISLSPLLSSLPVSLSVGIYLFTRGCLEL